ncbi:SH3 domain-containing protein [Leptospira sp. 201903071]|uniref:SH3 domain-containing protein n=1 Tax=Leptospira ainazelensis TaxID=2810034 RepID=UPI0019630EDE|nr:SH3 domain-containing protein [Leptospira ainazelensis]MBM9498951.1 SH3 domain-containing protein [Leptospira ainazelensis]
MFLRSEPSVESKPIEKLATKDIVEIIEDSKSSTSVQGKIGFWIRVKTKNQNFGFVFSPYVAIGNSIESLSSLTDIETNEIGWAYVKNKPNFIFSLQNKIFKKKENDQIKKNEFYLVRARYVTKDGKVFFRLLKQEARLEDWYSELEITKIADCYIPAEGVIISNKYASLYSKIREEDGKKIKIFEFLSQEVNDDINPEHTRIETFDWKRKKYSVVITSHKFENDECRGCFLPELYNLVYVLEEKGNSFNIIFNSGGWRSASFSNYDRPRITINDSPPPEGDDSPSRIISSDFEFNGKEFVLKSETNQ